MSKRWKIAVVALVAVLVLAAVAVGVVVADEPDEPERVGRPFCGPGLGGRGPFRGLKEVVGLLELEPRELLQALGEGKTIAELAGDKAAAVVKAMLAEGETRNADLVEGGLLTPEQADARNAAPRQRAEDMVNLPLPYGLQGEALRAAADVIGISIDDLISEIEDGKTIAEVAEPKGITVEQLVERLVTAREEALKELVELDLMTETQARLALDRYGTVAERFVTEGYQCPAPSGRFVQGIARGAVRWQGLQRNGLRHRWR